MRKRAKAGIVASLATALVTLTSTAAYAATTISASCSAAPDDGGGRDCKVLYYSNNLLASYGDFYANGEKLHAYDNIADGRGIYVEAQWRAAGSTQFESHRLTSGAGTQQTWDLNIAEGTSVTFTVCQTDNGSLVNCRAQTGIA